MQPINQLGVANKHPQLQMGYLLGSRIWLGLSSLNTWKDGDQIKAVLYIKWGRALKTRNVQRMGV